VFTRRGKKLFVGLSHDQGKPVESQHHHAGAVAHAHRCGAADVIGQHRVHTVVLLHLSGEFQSQRFEKDTNNRIRGRVGGGHCQGKFIAAYRIVNSYGSPTVHTGESLSRGIHGDGACRQIRIKWSAGTTLQQNAVDAEVSVAKKLIAAILQ
jgi:hypothetical protein